MNEIEDSIRKKIIRVLEGSPEPLDVDTIASIVGIENPREIYEHLRHIAKSIRRSNHTKALLMIPPKCRRCGYIFKDLDEPKKPSKCPACKGESIEPPRFIIRSTS